MRSANWLRRAQWLAMFAFLIAPAATWAQDQPDGPRPPREEREDREERRGPPERPSQYWLNMQVEDVPDSLAAKLELETDRGVVVQRVGDDGPAAKAGIKTNDVILEVGDTKIKGPRDVTAAVRASEGKELSVKLLRDGKPMTVAVTPGKRSEDVIRRIREGEFDARDLSDLERRIRDRLKDLPGDLKLQIVQPGRLFPPGMLASDFPDDLTVNIHKEGKKPADVEVKKGDKTWNVKEDDLSQLPDDVKPHVEAMLGRGPLPFRIHLGPGGPGGDHEFPGPRPDLESRRRRPPPPGDGPDGPDGPRPPRRADGPGASPPEPPDGPMPPDGPEGPRSRRPSLRGGGRVPPGDAPDERDREREGDRGRAEERLDRRLHEFDRRLQAMQEQIERLLKKE